MASDSVFVDTYFHVTEARCLFSVVLTGDSWVHCHVKAERHTSTAGTTGLPFLPVMCSRVCNGKSEDSKIQELSTLKVSQECSLEPQDRQVRSRGLSSLSKRELLIMVSKILWGWKLLGKNFQSEQSWTEDPFLWAWGQKNFSLEAGDRTVLACWATEIAWKGFQAVRVALCWCYAEL